MKYTTPIIFITFQTGDHAQSGKPEDVASVTTSEQESTEILKQS